MYFAESHALVHFLLTDSQSSGAKALDQYVAKIEAGGDSLEAARQAFGDLNQLQSRLDAYIKETRPAPSEVAASGGGDSGGSVRTLSLAESEARMADFSVQRGRRGDAEDKLEEALKLDPNLALAEQVSGFLDLKGSHLEDAEMHFEHAVMLDPNDALSYYGEGMVAVTRGGHVGIPTEAVGAFEKTVALNPDFAPAWYNLALIYVLRPETMQKALADAKRAASLVPGESGYQLQVATITERMDQNENARKISPPVRSASNSPSQANKAGDIVGQTPKPQATTAAPPIGNAPAKASNAGSTRIERKTEPDDKPAAAISGQPKAEPNPPPPPMAPPLDTSQARVYSMVGTITDVNCTNAPQVQITLKAQTLVMHLHADDLGHVSIKSSGATASARTTSCSSLRGRSARVSYFLVSDKTWDGEMQAVEFR
jgi:tetratricopeptide (TPR) repeat protein